MFTQCFVTEQMSTSMLPTGKERNKKGTNKRTSKQTPVGSSKFTELKNQWPVTLHVARPQSVFRMPAITWLILIALRQLKCPWDTVDLGWVLMVSEKLPSASTLFTGRVRLILRAVHKFGYFSESSLSCRHVTRSSRVIDLFFTQPRKKYIQKHYILSFLQLKCGQFGGIVQTKRTL